MEREELIKICKDAKVLYNKWRDRDSFSSQQSVMMVRLLLESGCEFRIRTNKTNATCVTDENTIWVDVYYDEWEDGERWHIHYLPTQKRLKEANGEDWY